MTDGMASPREVTDFARVDPALLGLNLFRPLPRRGRTQARLSAFDMKVKHDGQVLRITGSYVLGSEDLAVLLAVLALAGLTGKKIMADRAETSRAIIVDELMSRGDAVRAVHLRVRTNFHAICREAGLEISGQAYDRVTESLWRMAAITYADLGPICANSERIHAGSSQRLLTFSANKATREVVVVINARFSAVVLGPPYEPIDLHESRALGEVGRLVHFTLCLLVRQASRFRIGFDKLTDRVYGGPAASETQAKDRRREVRAALKEIAKFPAWTITDDRRSGNVLAARAKLRAPDTPALADDTDGAPTEPSPTNARPHRRAVPSERRAT